MARCSLLDDYLLSCGLTVRDNATSEFKSSPYGHLGSDEVPVTSPSRLYFDLDCLLAPTNVSEQVPSLHIPNVNLRYRELCDSLSLALQDIPSSTNSHLMKSNLPARGKPWDIGVRDTCFSSMHWQPMRSNVNLTGPPVDGMGSWPEQKPVGNATETSQSLENYWLANTLAADQTIGFDLNYYTGLDVPPLTNEDTGLPFPDISAPLQPAPYPPILRTSPVLPPPEHLVPYSGHQTKLLSEAFTEGSCHPNVALRGLLDCIMRSKFIANQEAEPTLADEYSIYVLAQIVTLPQCPSIDFSFPKRSLFTLFVDRPRYRCLMCNMHKSSLSRVLGCVRSHLGHRPFHCAGCQSCNQIDGFAKFWTSALLRDHRDGQGKKKKCTACGLGLRRGGMRRHWNAMHQGTPFPWQENPRYRNSCTPRSQSTESTPENVGELPNSHGPQSRMRRPALTCKSKEFRGG